MLKMNPYLGFNGEASEALAYYKGVFGGELRIITFSEFGSGPPGADDLVMHGQLDTANFTLMAYDDPERKNPTGRGNTTICIWGDDSEIGRAWFAKLAEDGTVDVEFAVQPWGDWYGTVTDRFGVFWGINVSTGQN
ncbi:hypothetical protein BW730_01540 [Tessaracoccus aquimaris]|uniref:PhnB-like domain-containing protein n=1 Tax=Tessaracoccus aquimaris TaxID=1332264 RepID=A0A1Q2CJZ6_9ACTN|nr:VOC family protein [Tessaracoccus aquimaris]AQP46437.1 hypothetical protein BW730_01540 [Tessaracoccus aquimaris]